MLENNPVSNFGKLVYRVAEIGARRIAPPRWEVGPDQVLILKVEHSHLAPRKDTRDYTHVLKASRQVREDLDPEEIAQQADQWRPAVVRGGKFEEAVTKSWGVTRVEKPDLEDLVTKRKQELPADTRKRHRAERWGNKERLTPAVVFARRDEEEGGTYPLGCTLVVAPVTEIEARRIKDDQGDKTSGLEGVTHTGQNVFIRAGAVPRLQREGQLQRVETPEGDIHWRVLQEEMRTRDRVVAPFEEGKIETALEEGFTGQDSFGNEVFVSPEQVRKAWKAQDVAKVEDEKGAPYLVVGIEKGVEVPGISEVLRIVDWEWREPEPKPVADLKEGVVVEVRPNMGGTFILDRPQMTERGPAHFEHLEVRPAAIKPRGFRSDPVRETAESMVDLIIPADEPGDKPTSFSGGVLKGMDFIAQAGVLVGNVDLYLPAARLDEEKLKFTDSDLGRLVRASGRKIHDELVSYAERLASQTAANVRAYVAREAVPPSKLESLQTDLVRRFSELVRDHLSGQEAFRGVGKTHHMELILKDPYELDSKTRERFQQISGGKTRIKIKQAAYKQMTGESPGPAQAPAVLAENVFFAPVKGGSQNQMMKPAAIPKPEEQDISGPQEGEVNND